MNMLLKAGNYLLMGSVLFSIERITKLFAVYMPITGYRITDYLSFELVYNRGASWGIFHSSSDAIFWLITGGVVIITIALIGYAIMRLRSGFLVVGEVMVIVGSLSNIMDRFLYNGVIDFIELSYKGWAWPSCNGADICIVIGVMSMLLEQEK